MSLPIYCGLLFIFSWGLTGLLLQYLSNKHILDIPNERSSHTIPTPRGGGLAFVFCFLASLALLFWSKQIDAAFFWPIFIASLLVVSLGYCDDRYHLSAKFRLLGHFIAASLIVYCFGDMSSSFSISITDRLLRILSDFVGVIYLAWFINFFNFMDGIDGLAAIQTVTVCLGGILLFMLDGQIALIIVPSLLTCAVAGFLLWNFPPARIFMGDAGSGFLGLLIGLVSFFSAKVDITLFYGWFILNGVFFCDASLTLLLRALRRENIFMAHCSHAYQIAARRYKSHKLVTLMVCGINCCWLFPLAVLVQQRLMVGPIAVIIAFIPLVILVFKFNVKNEVTLE